MLGGCWSRKPSRHLLSLQVLRQSSSLLELPSSHSSVRRLTLPSPHLLSLQVDRQSSLSSRLPSSHSSSEPTRALPHPPDLMQVVRSAEHSVPSGQNRPFAHWRELF